MNQQYYVVLQSRQQGKEWGRYILAAIRIGIPHAVIAWRINNGWPINKLHITSLEGL